MKTLPPTHPLEMNHNAAVAQVRKWSAIFNDVEAAKKAWANSNLEHWTHKAEKARAALEAESRGEISG